MGKYTCTLERGDYLEVGYEDDAGYHDYELVYYLRSGDGELICSCENPDTNEDCCIHEFELREIISIERISP